MDSRSGHMGLGIIRTPPMRRFRAASRRPERLSTSRDLPFATHVRGRRIHNGGDRRPRCRCCDCGHIRLAIGAWLERRQHRRPTRVLDRDVDPFDCPIQDVSRAQFRRRCSIHSARCRVERPKKGFYSSVGRTVIGQRVAPFLIFRLPGATDGIKA
jgi:hypothetical protein